MQRHEYVFTLTHTNIFPNLERLGSNDTPAAISILSRNHQAPFLPARRVAITVLLGNLGASGEAFKTLPVDNQMAFSHEEKK